MLILLILAEAVALVVVVMRLSGGRTRRPPELPAPGSGTPGQVTIVIASLNEATRIAPCLRGVSAQGAVVKEILVVDSNSTDGTRELVAAAAERDPRIRLLTDPPLPSGWVGKGWALQYGLEQATTEWVLGLDADTAPNPGLADAVVAAAEREGFDCVSFSPCFDGQSAAEQFVQPAILVTLIYRSGAAGDPRVRADRVIANGQCFLVRKAVLMAHGGYEPVRGSFAEDVALVRRLATRGVPVGFLDGSRLYAVRSYSGLPQMWREWGRSIALRDSISTVRQWGELLFLFCAQALPLPLAIALAAGVVPGEGAALRMLRGEVGALLAFRLLLLIAIRGSYARPGLTFWLSPLADPAAWWRIVLSTVRSATSWRTRTYGSSD
jgi:dolichol-phosphate mannosyltransferase